MPIPSDIRAIDLMLSVPGEDTSAWYEFMKPLFLDEDSRRVFKMPAEYMFKDIPNVEGQSDYIAYTVGQMDAHGVERAMVSIGGPATLNEEACNAHPDRFFASYNANPIAAWTRYATSNGW